MAQEFPQFDLVEELEAAEAAAQAAVGAGAQLLLVPNLLLVLVPSLPVLLGMH